MNIDDLLKNSDFDKYISKLKDAGIKSHHDLNQMKQTNTLMGILELVEPDKDLRLKLVGFLNKVSDKANKPFVNLIIFIAIAVGVAFLILFYQIFMF